MHGPELEEGESVLETFEFRMHVFFKTCGILVDQERVCVDMSVPPGVLKPERARRGTRSAGCHPATCRATPMGSSCTEPTEETRVVTGAVEGGTVEAPAETGASEDWRATPSQMGGTETPPAPPAPLVTEDIQNLETRATAEKPGVDSPEVHSRLPGLYGEGQGFETRPGQRPS